MGYTPTYEDPTRITSPIIVRIVRTFLNEDPTDILSLCNTPLRDHSYLGTDYKTPRLLAWGPDVRAASNWLTGQLEVQTTSATLADPDYLLRRYIIDRGGAMMSLQFIDYAFSPEQRVIGGDARILARGYISTDQLAENLTFKMTGRDVFGFGANILRSETMIPQRLIETDFPGFGRTDANTERVTNLGVPAIYGLHSDENLPYGPDHPTLPDGTPVRGGTVPVIYVGKTMTRVGLKHTGLVCGHACPGRPVALGGVAGVYGILGLFDNSSPPSTVAGGSEAWFPGGNAWPTVNPTGDGTPFYTTRNGNVYTLIYFNDTLGDAFAKGQKSFFVNTYGMPVNPDGSGGAISNLHDQYLHAFENHLLPTPPWTSGSYFTGETTQFQYYPTGPFINSMDASSWARAKAVWAACYQPEGATGAFVLGVAGRQEPIRSVLAEFCIHTHSSLGTDEFQRYFISTLDTRNDSHVNARRITQKDNTLVSGPLTATLEPDLLVNLMRVAYGVNLRTNEFRGVIENPVDHSTFLASLTCEAEPETWSMITDPATAAALYNARYNFRKRPRRTVVWKESWASGERTHILNVVLMTHISGDGYTRSGDSTRYDGYNLRPIWVQRKVVNSDGTIDFSGYDVNDLVTVGVVNRFAGAGGVAPTEQTGPIIGFGTLFGIGQ